MKTVQLYLIYFILNGRYKYIKKNPCQENFKIIFFPGLKSLEKINIPVMKKSRKKIFYDFNIKCRIEDYPRMTTENINVTYSGIRGL